MDLKASGLKIGFIGVGNMGSALVRGIIEGKVVNSEQVLVSDADTAHSLQMASEYGVKIAKTNEELVSASDVVILAVKPQVIPRVLDGLQYIVTEGQTFISVAAGVTIKKLEAFIPDKAAVVRVLPNLPCLIGSGVSVISPGSRAGAEDIEITEELLKGIGIVLHVREKDMDAVTALSGSGPAYVFLILEALTEAGVRVGLSREISEKLAVHTLVGAGKMVLETGRSPEELRWMVSSPGGTTIAALHLLEKAGLRAALMDAVVAACRRAEELGLVEE